MSIKARLIAMSFLQFFVWGSWLISLGGYMIVTLNFTGVEVGSIFSTMGIASLFMPAIMGIISDRFYNAEKVLGFCHIVGAALLLLASNVTDYPTLYIIMLFNSMFYMPTIALSNTVSYNALEKNGLDIVKSFPPIRVWGTIGFIAAMWIVDILDEYIKPAVAGDGGNIAFRSYDESNKIVSVVLQGACSGCPSSTATLKNGIENLLKEMLPNQINGVVAING